jgi:hypothetical protein
MHKNIIVTTTINAPTKAIHEFCKKRDWHIIIVGDLKTPHDKYLKLSKQYPNTKYLSPEIQEKKYKKLSQTIGWNCIQRRNIGFVEAYHLGASIIATVDDDNIPYEDWGQNLFINQEVSLDYYETDLLAFDPLSVTKNNHLWHRGYPLELLQQRHKVNLKGKIKRKVLVQADLWNGDPDIDAMARLTFKPIVNFTDIVNPYCSNKISPFNSQNTFLSQEVLPYYAVLPHIGRMDDIWGGYILQNYFKDCVIYNKATVYQDRNVQDLITNLEKEILGYRYTYQLLMHLKNYSDYLPTETIEFYKEYQRCFK